MERTGVHTNLASVKERYNAARSPTAKILVLVREMQALHMLEEEERMAMKSKPVSLITIEFAFINIETC